MGSGRTLRDFNLDRAKGCFKQLIQFVEVIDEEPSPIIPANQGPKPSALAKEIFVVHGHDEKRLAQVESTLLKIGLSPIILRKQPNGGRTIIEKFEESSNVGFAIVIMTSDDIGSAKITATDAKPRARQNVILELGYFVGKLGRGRVAVLKEKDVEEPSDIHGIVYTELDANDTWQYQLVAELRHAGFKVSADMI